MKQYILYYNNGATKKVAEKEINTHLNDTVNFYAEDKHSFNWNSLLNRWETNLKF